MYTVKKIDIGLLPRWFQITRRLHMWSKLSKSIQSQKNCFWLLALKRFIHKGEHTRSESQIIYQIWRRFVPSNWSVAARLPDMRTAGVKNVVGQGWRQNKLRFRQELNQDHGRDWNAKVPACFGEHNLWRVCCRCTTCTIWMNIFMSRSSACQIMFWQLAVADFGWQNWIYNKSNHFLLWNNR